MRHLPMCGLAQGPGIGSFPGPFPGVFLQARGWDAGMIGTVRSIGGTAGMRATSPNSRFQP